MTHRNVTGIVLAGGKSSRMGTDKAMLIWHGKPLIQHAVDILQQVCSEVVISANHNHYAFTGCDTWPDVIPLQAPIAGIHACLKRSLNDWNVVLSCDMPYMDPRLFEFLLASADDLDVVVPVHGRDHIEPLCGIYNKSVIQLIEDQICGGDYTLRHLIGHSKHRLLEIGPPQSFYTSELFTNVNTGEELGMC